MLSSKIDLNGTPLPVTKGLWRQAVAFMMRPDILSLAPVVMASGVLAESALPGSGAREAANIFTSNAVSILYYYMYDKGSVLSHPLFFGDRAEKLAIEMKPEITPPPSVGDYALRAEMLKTWMLKRLVVGPVLCTAACLAIDATRAAANPAFVPSPATLLCFFSGGVSLFDAYRRWHKVENGEWEIVDKPALKEPVPVREQIKKLVGAPSPMRAPAAG